MIGIKGNKNSSYFKDPYVNTYNEIIIKKQLLQILLRLNIDIIGRKFISRLLFSLSSCTSMQFAILPKSLKILANNLSSRSYFF